MHARSHTHGNIFPFLNVCMCGHKSKHFQLYVYATKENALVEQ